MEAKVMKEMLEEKSGLTAEYQYAVSDGTSGTSITRLTFSKTPKFVVIAVYAPSSRYTDSNYAFNVAWNVSGSVYYAADSSKILTCSLNFVENTLILSGVSGRVHAVAFY